MMEPEKQLMDRAILKASKMKVNLFRNDNGRARRYDNPEQVFSYGLGKGTHDLIGWMPVEITEEMVGKTVAQFVSIEMKRGTDRLSKEQRAFLRSVNDAGGLSFVAETAEEAVAVLKMDRS